MQGDQIGRYAVGGGAGCQRGGQCGQRRLPEQFADGERIPRPTQAFDKLNRQQGVAAELEEVILPPDAFNAQQVLPYRGNRLFGGGLRCLIGGTDKGAVIRRGQGVAVHLAMPGQRYLRQRHIGRRHHKIRQTARELLFQCLNGNGCL